MGIIKKHIVISAALLALLCCPFKQLFSQNEITYNIGILLPFSSDGTDAANRNAEAIIDYYQGAKIAMADLEQYGFKCSLFVWDSQLKDSIELIKLSKTSEFRKLDVLFGPISQNQVNLLSSSISNKGLIWVSPLKNLKMPKAITSVNFFSPDSLRIKGLANILRSRFKNHQFCLIDDGSIEAKRDIGFYQKYFKEQINKRKYGIYKLTNGKISPNLPKSDSILLIQIGESQAVKTTLYKLIEKKPGSFIVGSFDWYDHRLKIEETDETKILYPTINFSRGADSLTRKFSRTFVDEHQGEPSRFAYQGHDQFSFIGFNLMTYGNQFPIFLNTATMIGFINNIALAKNANGYYNIGVRLVKYKGNEKLLY
jgi:hypothetical protein